MTKDKQGFNPYASNYWETSYPKPEKYQEEYSDSGASDEVYSDEERQRWELILSLIVRKA